jgi:hypothetical protein
MTQSREGVQGSEGGPSIASGANCSSLVSGVTSAGRYAVQ